MSWTAFNQQCESIKESDIGQRQNNWTPIAIFSY